MHNEIDINEIKNNVRLAVEELFQKTGPNVKILALGCSTSEICGKQIGKGPSAEVGMAVVETVLSVANANGSYLAVQGCEHINRALVIEKEAAEKYGFEIVSVVPALCAGGAACAAAYRLAKDPVMIEYVKADAGIDIGDTLIGMHIKHVQIPVRVSVREIGGAHVTCAASRPKLIGGAKARYSID